MADSKDVVEVDGRDLHRGEEDGTDCEAGKGEGGQEDPSQNRRRCACLVTPFLSFFVVRRGFDASDGVQETFYLGQYAQVRRIRFDVSLDVQTMGKSFPVSRFDCFYGRPFQEKHFGDDGCLKPPVVSHSSEGSSHETQVKGALSLRAAVGASFLLAKALIREEQGHQLCRHFLPVPTVISSA
jgi:hypothetical protein